MSRFVFFGGGIELKRKITSDLIREILFTKKIITALFKKKKPGFDTSPSPNSGLGLDWLGS